MISLSGPDRVVAVMRLDEANAPTKTALFSRRELRRALDVLDALDPEDQRIELALLDASAPVLVARPRDTTGEGWVAVAGHSEAVDSVTSAEETPAPAPAPKEAPKEAPKGPVTRDPPEAEPKPKTEPKPKAVPAAKPTPKKQEAPAPKPTEEEPAPAAEEVCEQCGATVSKTQKQMSMLFLNKTLCKACMDAATKGVKA